MTCHDLDHPAEFHNVEIVIPDIYQNANQVVNQGDLVPEKLEYFDGGVIRKRIHQHIHGDGVQITYYHMNGIKMQDEFWVDGKLHQIGAPAVIAYHKNGALWHKIYYQNGKMHRGENQPAHLKYFANGSEQTIEYWIDGIRHCDDGPAVAFYNSRGICYFKSYYQNNKTHRIGGPAIVQFYKDGGVCREIYCIDGLQHRADNEPADISYNKLTGNITSKLYFVAGVRHRVDGPSEIVYNTEGNLQCTKYEQHGRYHRLDGPALFKYYASGVIESETYYKNGKKHSDDNIPTYTWYSENGDIKSHIYWRNGKFIKF